MYDGLHRVLHDWLMNAWDMKREGDMLRNQLDAHHTTIMYQMASIEKKDARIAKLKGPCG